MHYLDFFTQMHARLRPQTYLEIGVASGRSIGLAPCRTVGVDPAFAITRPIDGDIALVRTTSDEFFSRPEPLALTGGKPFDLAFIDGLHLFEFALRDFINTERHSTEQSLIVFDDVLPRTVDEAARERHTKDWTGDIFRMLPVLAEYRPEISVLAVDTQPTGLLLVMGLDPTSTVLVDRYDEIMRRHRLPDPQDVPAELLDRTSMLPAERVLESTFWELLRDSRGGTDTFREDLSRVLESSLGPAFATSRPS
jgi:hypothetical protein